MGENKQPQLNGAYYGPSIPPPSKSRTYHSQGRGGGCNPFSCLCNCLCTCVFQILCTLLVIAGILILVLWLVFRPNMLVFHASDASLTEFTLDNNTLRYNLAVNLTIRNPNRRVRVYYDGIEARAFYQGQRFAATQLQPFYQGTKNTSYSTAEFSGQHLVMLGGRELTNYNEERGSGVYDIDVQLHMRIRLRFWFVRTMRWRPRIDCNDLRIPLNSNGTVSPGATYQARRCRFHWR